MIQFNETHETIFKVKRTATMGKVTQKYSNMYGKHPGFLQFILNDGERTTFFASYESRTIQSVFSFLVGF